MSYPVVWRNQTYYLGDLTIKVKNEFVKWAKLRLTQEGIENLGHRPDLLASYLATLYGELWWADGTMSKPCHVLLNSPDGGRQLNRLLFGDSAKTLSDSDLDALLDEKERDPASDYMAAMRMLREAADPKSHTGPAPTGGTSSTGASAPSPSGSPATNSTG